MLLLFASLLSCSGPKGSPGTESGDGSTTESGDGTTTDSPSETGHELDVGLPTRDSSTVCKPSEVDDHPDECTKLGDKAACINDSDCTAGSNGQCELHWYWIDCHCTYDVCAADTDCASGTVCGCGSEPEYGLAASTCLPSDCRTNADCASGLCMGDRQPSCPNNGSITGWFCATPTDTCRSDDACTGGDRCMFDANTDRWACADGGITCG